MRPSLQLFSDAWKVLVANLQVFVVLSLITSVFITAIMFSLGIEPVELDDKNSSVQEIVFMFLAGFVSILTSIAIIKLIVEPMHKEIDSLYRFALTNFPAYLWVSILTGISIMIGFVLLIFPGIFLLISLAFATLLVVAEGAHGVDALKRSRDYVRGHWFQVFGRYAFLMFIGISIMLILDIFFGAYVKLMNPYVYSVLIGTLGTIVTCFTSSYTYLLYTDLKDLAVPEAQPVQDPTSEVA